MGYLIQSAEPARVHNCGIHVIEQKVWLIYAISYLAKMLAVYNNTKSK